MDTAIVQSYFKEKEIQYINIVRLFLQVLIIAGLTTLLGDQLFEDIQKIKHKPRDNNYIEVEQEEPPKEAWDAWDIFYGE